MKSNTSIIMYDCFVDFYISEKYKTYKTKRGRLKYTYKKLQILLDSVVGKVVNGVEIRKIRILSDFWTDMHPIEINDIGYNCNNLVPLNEDHITLRSFSIEVIGILVERQVTNFLDYSNEGISLQACSFEIF